MFFDRSATAGTRAEPGIALAIVDRVDPDDRVTCAVRRACVHVPLRARASVRRAEYLETHRELPPRIADAIDRGHVVTGMDQEQVVVVLGQPLKRTDYLGAPPAEVWLYPGHRFHQDQVRTHGATLFRLVFVDGRLMLFEPL